MASLSPLSALARQPLHVFWPLGSALIITLHWILAPGQVGAELARVSGDAQP
jgi:hypothetical protein